MSGRVSSPTAASAASSNRLSSNRPRPEESGFFRGLIVCNVGFVQGGIDLVIKALAMPEMAVKPGPQRPRDHEKTDGKRELEGRRDMGAAADQRKYQRLRQVTQQRTGKERDGTNAGNAGCQIGQQIVADGQQPNQYRHGKRMVVNEAVKPPGALSQPRAQQAFAEEAREDEALHAAQQCSECAEKRAETHAEGIATEKCNDLARQADGGAYSAHQQEQQCAVDAVTADPRVDPGLVDAAAEIAGLEQVAQQRQAQYQRQALEDDTRFHSGRIVQRSESASITGRRTRRCSQATPNRSTMPTHNRLCTPYLEVPRSRAR